MFHKRLIVPEFEFQVSFFLKKYKKRGLHLQVTIKNILNFFTCFIEFNLIYWVSHKVVILWRDLLKEGDLLQFESKENVAYNKSGIGICDSLYETSFTLLSLDKQRNKKRRTSFKLSWRDEWWGDSGRMGETTWSWRKRRLLILLYKK